MRGAWGGCLLCGLLVGSVVWGQVPVIPDSLVRQGALARTDRFEGTHTTSLAVDYQGGRERLVAGVRAYLSSTTTFLGSFSTRDGLDAVLDIEYRLPSSMRLFAIAEGALANDARPDIVIPGLDKTASALLAVGGRVYDGQGGRLGLAVGGAYNRQLNVEDRGLALYAELQGDRVVDDYALQVDARLRASNIAPRHNANGYGQARIARIFEEGGSASLELRYDLVRTDLYIARSLEEILQTGGETYSGLRERSEGRFRAFGLLSYPVDADLTFDLSMGVTTYGIGQQQLTEGLPPLPGPVDPFRFDRDELGLSLAAAMEWRPGSIHLGGRFEYWTSEEGNTVLAVAPVTTIELDRQRASSAQNDYTAQQVRLVGSAQAMIGASDTVSVSGSIGIYRYDTPSALNAFDRDEQSIHAELRWQRRFSPLLSLDLMTQAFLTHLVYLFGQNSNDNNWNRIVRFAPTISYHPQGPVHNDLTAEVTANYTEYDFDDRSQTVRGRSFREIHLRDSIAIALTQRVALRATGVLRVAERGSFNWERFVESPLERVRTEGIEAEVTTVAGRSVLAGVGGRLSRVKSFRAFPGSTELQPFSDRTSIGPTARLEFRLSASTDVLFSGWWEHRFDESRLAAKLPWLNLSVGWRY